MIATHPSPPPALDEHVAELARNYRALDEQVQRLEIALDETRASLRATRHELRTGRTPEEAMQDGAIGGPVAHRTYHEVADDCPFCREPCQFCAQMSPRTPITIADLTRFASTPMFDLAEIVRAGP
jgi:hypothetical protein